MQPLLLVKQTLEVGYDPGPLLLDGPNVSFGRVSEMLWRGRGSDVATEFSVDMEDWDGEAQGLTFSGGGKRLDVVEDRYKPPTNGRTFPTAREHKLRPTMSRSEIIDALVDPYRDLVRRRANAQLKVQRRRCFLEIWLSESKGDYMTPLMHSTLLLQWFATRLLHLRGLRDPPERLYAATYPASQGVDVFPGPFPPYVASIIAGWAEENDPRLSALNADLQTLGLTWKVGARRIEETRVALLVGRLPHGQRGGARDLVSIADVGLGVSQSLPILVALRIARPRQIVYLEQPEVHLHPRAQVALGPILVDAARRGVLVVCETHSHLLLKSIQNVAARSSADAGLMRLHWFARDSDGVTRVTSGTMDAKGAYGDVPVDYVDVELNLENQYLDSIQANW